jgi:hypothetical protein
MRQTQLKGLVTFEWVSIKFLGGGDRLLGDQLLICRNFKLEAQRRGGAEGFGGSF